MQGALFIALDSARNAMMVYLQSTSAVSRWKENYNGGNQGILRCAI